MDNHWNYRLVRRSEDGEMSCGICEVHYCGDKITSITEDYARVSSENSQGVLWILENMKEAMKKPILDWDEVCKEFDEKTCPQCGSNKITTEIINYTFPYGLQSIELSADVPLRKCECGSEFLDHESEDLILQAIDEQGKT